MKAIIRSMPLSSDMKKVADQIKAQVEGDVKKDQKKAIDRAVKMACMVLYNEFGFRNKRLCKFVEELHNGCNEIVARPEEWYHIDEKLEQMGLYFDKEDIEEREEHSRDVYHEKGRKFREYK